MSILLSFYQPALPIDRIIVRDALSVDAVAMDVVFVGGGPAGFAGAMELARLVKRENESGGSRRRSRASPPVLQNGAPRGFPVWIRWIHYANTAEESV